MKNLIFNLIAICSFALSVQTLQAQTISAEDQKGIEACYTGFKMALEKMDASATEALLTENAEQIIPNGNIIRGRANVVANIKGYMEFLKTLPKPDRYETKNLGTQNRYLAPGLILSTYTEENTLTFGDQTKVEKTAYAVVLKKSNDKWLADLLTITSVVPMPEMGK